MPTQPHPDRSSDASAAQFSDVFYRSLKEALARQFRQRYKASVRLNRTRMSDSDDSQMRIVVTCPGLAEMPVWLKVSHAGGNMYDVLCTVPEGSSHRFSKSLPTQTKATLSYDPTLGQEIATFLREEMEMRVGRRLLRSPASPPLQSTL